MPIAISAEQRALQASIRDWAERVGTLALLRSLVVAERALGLPRAEAR